MPTMEYANECEDPTRKFQSAGMPLAQVDTTNASKRRRLSPPQDAAGARARSGGEPSPSAGEKTAGDKPSSSAGSENPLLDSMSQLIQRYSDMVQGRHTLLWHQFQYLQQEFIQLNHQLQYVHQAQLSNSQQLQIARQRFDAKFYYDMLHHFQNRQQEIVQLHHRIQHVQQSQRAIAEAAARLQQDRQKAFAAYNSALQHLEFLARNGHQVEQNHTHDNDCIEFAPNDPTLTELIHFNPGLSDRDWAKAGADIGQHSYLQKLNFHDVRCVPRADWEALMRGMASNRSINTLELISCNSCWGNIFQILTPFIEHNTNLSRISVASSWSITDKEIGSFASILAQGGGSNLQDIDFSGVRMKDEVAAYFISCLIKLPQLRELDLRSNGIAMRGCEALAALLRHPESKLETLKLGSNNIGDKEAELLAESLSGNTAMTTLALSNCGQNSKLQGHQPHNSITPKGWAAFSNAIRVCNHTLQSVSDPDKSLSQDKQAVSNELESTYELEYLLKMNSKEDKKAVAQQKAILIKDIIGIEFDDALKKKKVLPNILARITRASQGSGSELVPLFVLIRNTLPLWSGEQDGV